uniref:Uncharacterized protein n=1 Tax=Cyanistes caeruleus TaxID=156563 RepID=A0A8C0U2U8_CYACU
MTVSYSLLTSLSFSLGISNTHLNLESINSSGFKKSYNNHFSPFLLTTVVCTINLCLLFSFGS